MQDINAKNMATKNYENRKRRKNDAKNFNIYGIVEGETYGNYKVLEKIKVPQRISRGNGVYVECMATKWRCLHLTTNEEKIVPTGYLSEFKCKSLEDKVINELVKENKHQIGFKNKLYRQYKRNAKNRKHQFLLTQEEFENIIFQDCFYCGEKPRPMTQKQIEQHGNSKQPPLNYNGIDRLDPSKDYIVENCVPCCPTCNYMKHISSLDNFKNHIHKIYNHLNLGSTIGDK